MANNHRRLARLSFGGVDLCEVRQDALDFLIEQPLTAEGKPPSGIEILGFICLQNMLAKLEKEK